MVQQHISSEHLDATFSALADPTRRAILARLASGETSVSELAEPFEMSMPAISKHLKVLQRAGLIERGREAQWRPCRLAAGPLKDASDWLDHYRRFWEEAFDRLEDYLRECRRGLAKRRRTKMAARSNAAAESVDRELVITRVFDAPRELVWKAFTERERMAKWWGIKGFTTRILELDLRPGGTFLYSEPDAGRPRDGRQVGVSGNRRARVAGGRAFHRPMRRAADPASV